MRLELLHKEFAVPPSQTQGLPCAGDAVTVVEFFSIADLAAEFSITARAIRFYEDQGLIEPMRRGNSRVYTRRDRARLAWVLRGKRVGFSLAEIKELLDLYDTDDGRATQRLRAREKCRERIAALQAQRADIDHMIDELKLFDATISGLIAQDHHTTKV